VDVPVEDRNFHRKPLEQGVEDISTPCVVCSWGRLTKTPLVCIILVREGVFVNLASKEEPRESLETVREALRRQGR